MTKHQPKKHLVHRRESVACEADNIKVANTTAVPERVTCARCRSTPQYVDAVARRLVMNPGRRPRKATR